MTQCLNISLATWFLVLTVQTEGFSFFKNPDKIQLITITKINDGYLAITKRAFYVIQSAYIFVFFLRTSLYHFSLKLRLRSNFVSLNKNSTHTFPNFWLKQFVHQKLIRKYAPDTMHHKCDSVFILVWCFISQKIFDWTLEQICWCFLCWWCMLRIELRTCRMNATLDTVLLMKTT